MQRHLRWHQAIAECQKSHRPWAMATVLDTRGSTPREAGTKMVITEQTTFDTIGGGTLEYLVIEKARELLTRGEPQQHTEHFPLSSKTRQCCGGTVTILLESFLPQRAELHLFGAGHVAKALISILAELELSVHWVDSRREQFPAMLPANVNPHVYEDVLDHIGQIRPGALALVLTHDHSLDYSLTKALMDRDDCQFIGLIGSKTKALRFKKRLRAEAFSAAAIDAVTCPVGLSSVPGKQPMEVAVSIAGQIIQLLHAEDAASRQSGVSWRELVQDLVE